MNENIDWQAHYEGLARMHKKIACNRGIAVGVKMTVSDGAAKLTLPMRPDFYHAAKAVHGFIYFKMLDEAAFFAANSKVHDVFVLTAEYTTHLLHPITEGTMHAEGRVINETRSNILAEADLFNDEGKKIATGRGSFVRSRIPLVGLDGYAAD